MKKILITGKNGQVGWELQRTLSTMGQIIAIDQEDVDFASPEGLRQCLRQVKPDIIVNTAAYTAVDKAESDFSRAMDINGHAPGVLAEESKRLGAILIHYSTDYVYDGQSKVPYEENARTDPQNKYGVTKLAGDFAVAAAGGAYVILRTSWIYGARGKNFLLTMLKLAKEKQELKIVNDQIGAPTWSRMIAQATAQILNQAKKIPEASGTYHLTNAGQTSWCEFAEAIFNHSEGPKPRVIGIPTTDYPTPAKRPAYSVLSNAKIGDVFKVCMPSWEVGMRLCLEEQKIY